MTGQQEERRPADRDDEDFDLIERSLGRILRVLRSPRFGDAIRGRAGIKLDRASYGVLERTSDLLCVSGDFGWNDVGSWSALAEIISGDPVRVGGPTITLGARGTIAVSDPDTLVAVIGLDDVVVVQSGGTSVLSVRQYT